MASTISFIDSTEASTTTACTISQMAIPRFGHEGHGSPHDVGAGVRDRERRRLAAQALGFY